MKRIFRIFIFSCFALFLTSYWNKGFILPTQTVDFVKAGIALMILFVIVRPLMKIVFLPLNILTFGLFSFVLYVLSLHVLSSGFDMFVIKSWHFPGISLFIASIPPTQLSYAQNLVLSSFSLSSIINVLDQLT
ncbi:MAG: phage holin family protein [Microgenomates group bacterium]